MEISKSSNYHMPEIKFELIEEGFLPKQTMPGDAGHDVRACLRADESNKKYMELQADIDQLLEYIIAAPRAFSKLTNVYVDGELQRFDNLDEVALSLKKNSEAKELLLLTPANWEEVKREMGWSGRYNKRSLNLPNWFPVPLGFKVQLPDSTPLGPFVFVMDIVSRSGLGTKHGIVIKQGEGTVDSGYRDEVKAPLENRGNGMHFFTKGARIAQVKIYPCISLAEYREDNIIVEQVEQSVRGTKGFGASGT